MLPASGNPRGPARGLGGRGSWGEDQDGGQQDQGGGQQDQGEGFGDPRTRGGSPGSFAGAPRRVRSMFGHGIPSAY